MDAILNAVEGTSSQVDASTIDLDKLRIFQAKCSVWDFYDMTKEKYTNKLPSEKQDLIISYYNKMVLGMLLVICCLESVKFHSLYLESDQYLEVAVLNLLYLLTDLKLILIIL